MKKIGEHELTDAFDAVAEDLGIFVAPIFRAAGRNETLTQQWKIGVGWIAQVQPARVE